MTAQERIQQLRDEEKELRAEILACEKQQTQCYARIYGIESELVQLRKVERVR